MTYNFFTCAAFVVVVVHAGAAWQQANAWSGFQFPQMPNYILPTPPTPPTPPTLPTFPTLPFAPFRPFAPFLPFAPVAPIAPVIPPPLRPADIINMLPGPGQSFNGIAVSSVSGVTKDKDGNIVKTGGTTVLTNEDGVTQEFKVGENPPDINKPIVVPPLPTPPKLPTLPKLPSLPTLPTLPNFEPIEVKIPEFNPIEIDVVPGGESHFSTVSSSSFSHSSDINGEKTAGGGHKVYVNVDGEVQQEGTLYGVN